MDKRISVIGLRRWNCKSSYSFNLSNEDFLVLMVLILYLQVFEYAEDLEYYWIDGYGYNITYRQACPPVKDMMQHFQ